VIHCHNNFGKKDEHLSIEDGTIDWDLVISELFRKGFDGIFVVEAYEKPYDCLRRLREKIMLKKKMQV
jgi:sugar phosphate isomerase/epimerase